jgi:hypothetical protein
MPMIHIMDDNRHAVIHPLLDYVASDSIVLSQLFFLCPLTLFDCALFINLPEDLLQATVLCVRVSQ